MMKCLSRKVIHRNAKRLVLSLAGMATVAGQLVLAVVAAPKIQAQPVTTASRLTFDAASVRPVPPDSSIRTFTTGIADSPDPGLFRYTNCTLMRLLLDAYDVHPFQIVAPNWLSEVFFDVQATLPPATTKLQLDEMLQSLLAERFRLTLHRETRDLPIYSIMVARGGPKINEVSGKAAAEPDDLTPGHPGPVDAFGLPTLHLAHPGIFVIQGPVTRIMVKQQTMSQFSNRLAQPLGRMVVDATGLTGQYDFTVTFANEGRGGPQPELDGAPDVRVAIQEQLGLRLESGKGPVDVIVVDHIEKTPTEN
jgi:uncharacterized protein (TIGR03435 family)